MKSRLYSIGYGQTIRLILANTKLQALDFAAKGTINVQAVKKDDLADAYLQGRWFIKRCTKTSTR